MYSNFKYNINEEKGTVVAYMTLDDFKSELLYWLYSKEVGDVMSDVITNTVDKFFENYPSSITAKAQLADEDTWDEKVGIDLAQRRLKTKVRNLKGRFYDTLSHNCSKFYRQIMQPVFVKSIKYNTAVPLDK